MKNNFICNQQENMNNDAILIKDLEFRYSPTLPPTLKGINLMVKRGELVAILGANGAGKTTLAKHLNGILLPHSGKVLIFGQDTRSTTLEIHARTVGYCYQNPDHQIFSSSVYKEVAFGLYSAGVRGSALEKPVEEALRLVNLWDFREEHPFTLGRGQRQHLILASIITMNPSILVIDEPTTGMDHRDAIQIMELLKSRNRDGQTIIIITHDMNIVAEYVARSIVMHGGKILLDGATKDVFQDEKTISLAQLQVPIPMYISQKLSDVGIKPCLTSKYLINQISNKLR